ncbi:MAG: hypothetical protein PHY57_05600 [Ignavibacterium sp.]|nr:hypothetical protein [Ignavibacterium sp.]
MPINRHSSMTMSSVNGLNISASMEIRKSAPNPVESTSSRVSFLIVTWSIVILTSGVGA